MKQLYVLKLREPRALIEAQALKKPLTCFYPNIYDMENGPDVASITDSASH
jgi:hypothetical protein